LSPFQYLPNTLVRYVVPLPDPLERPAQLTKAMHLVPPRFCGTFQRFRCLIYRFHEA